MLGLLASPIVLLHALAASRPDHAAPDTVLTRFVLTRTHHPGNVGAAARAIKTMGFDSEKDSLWLVKPRDPKVLRRARAKEAASGAVDVLQNAQVVDTLEEALQGCQVCCGTGMPVDMCQTRSQQTYVEPRPFLEELVQQEQEHNNNDDPLVTTTVAFVFGNERVGLSEQEFACCDVILGIPTNPKFGSLNLASAVQLIAYDWRVALGGFPLDQETANSEEHISAIQPAAATDSGDNTVVVDESGARSVFGTKEYWDEQYQGRGDFPADCYSWYYGWEVVGKIVATYVPNKQARILVPGVGNDSILLDLSRVGYTNVLGQDYSEHAVERQQELLSYEFLEDQVPVLQGDVTNLPTSWENSFDIVLEKGCLDAVYLSGDGNVEAAVENLGRVLKPGGRLLSFSGVVPHELRQELFSQLDWRWLEDTSSDLKAGCFVLEKRGGTTSAAASSATTREEVAAATW